MRSVWKAAADLHRAGTAFVTVTMVSTRGHAPQDPGAKALVSASGLEAGTVGGGKVEARCIEHAKKWIEGSSRTPRPPELVTWNLQRDIGMSCGGEVTYLFELHAPSHWKIAVFGAGHVAQALVRTLEPLACSLTVIDSRPEWLERLPADSKAKRILVTDPSEGVAGRDPDSYFLVMTRGHATDFPVLRAIHAHFPHCAYVGVIGSDVKALKIRSEMKAEGMRPEFIEKLRSPMGLPLGGNAPAEIAISIAAELLQFRDRLAQASE